MNDTYYAVVQAQWANIRMLYHHFEQQKPIMLFDVQEQRIYAYPYEDFKAELSERSRTVLEEQYRRALEDQKVVVFVRDNAERRLVSYAVGEEDMTPERGSA